jgi:putative exosortase-associated protein (TIGR04073 family)
MEVAGMCSCICYYSLRSKNFLTRGAIFVILYTKGGHMKRFFIVAVIGVLLLSIASPVWATEPKDKLSRGTANVLAAFLEVPQNIDIEWKQSNNAAVGLFGGLFKGLFWSLARGVSGLWDVVTFAFPSPIDYKSIIQPEYVQRGVQTHFLSDEQNVK